jgi:hypothetical protein
VRKLVRARVELPVGEPLATVFQRDRAGAALDLRFEEVRDACLRWMVAP